MLAFSGVRFWSRSSLGLCLYRLPGELQSRFRHQEAIVSGRGAGKSSAFRNVSQEKGSFLSSGVIFLLRPCSKRGPFACRFGQHRCSRLW